MKQIYIKPLGPYDDKYQIETNAKNLKEFVEEVLNERKDEWGYIGIDDGTSVFGDPKIEYRHGSQLQEFPSNILNCKIIDIKADGGWSRMDYKLKLEENEN